MLDFYLQNVQTRETVKLPPERFLIGTAEHATLQTADGGPYLAALVVRYSTGWAVYGLSDDGMVTYNRALFGPGQRIDPKKGDLLIVGSERFSFMTPQSGPTDLVEADPPPCYVYVRNPDGMEECRAVDHNLLFGRLSFCHVQLADSRLSRLGAMLAPHDGVWYIHNLAKKPIGRNRKAVTTCARVENGDELLIGPLVVRVEIRGGTREREALAELSDSTVSIRRGVGLAHTDIPETSVDMGDSLDEGLGLIPQDPSGQNAGIRDGAKQLERWLKGQEPVAAAQKTGLGGWLGAQRDKLRRFWLDSPETATARGLRTAGRFDEAFEVLNRAIRARPEGPELLRELYRLYEAAGLYDLCYRPLRHIEKLADARGAPDPWVLETLARLCEQLGIESPSMADRALKYWLKLEAATGASTQRQRADVMARRTLREGGYANTADEE
jgi:hypothetical protein